MSEILKDPITTGRVADKHRFETEEFFVRKGWRIGKLSDLDQARRQDARITDPYNCVDPRRYSDNPDSSLAPAFFGAVHGFVAMLDHGIQVKERQRRVVYTVKEKGGTPADHGDEENGELLGCTFNKEWVGGRIIWLPKIAPEAILHARKEHDLQHQTLRERGRNRIKGLCLNLEPDTVIVPNGQCYSAELDYAIQIGSLLNLSFRDFVSFAERVGRVLLHDERVVYIC